MAYPIDVRNAREADYSDAYKAVVGMSPRFSLAHLSDDELEADIAALHADAAEGCTFDREYCDDDEDFDPSWFTVTTGEAGEDY
jgi:hypothetical protein